MMESLTEFIMAERTGHQEGERKSPFRGELCGEVGGEESWEDVLDIVSSAGLLWRSRLPSSDKERIFFKACGELMPGRERTSMCRITGRTQTPFCAKTSYSILLQAVCSLRGLCALPR